jgi:F-type H+-transporting ATPase subunit b
MATETHGAVTEHAQGMPQLDFSTFPNQIFWLVVTIVVIYLILQRVALPRIASVLADRSASIQRDLDKAEDYKRNAVEAEEAYNKALADARAEAHEIVNAARVEIQKDLDAAIAKADAEIAAKSAESEKAIAEIRKTAMKSVKTVANKAAVDIVEAIMPSVSDAKAIKDAVAERVKG